ncbi:cytochrome b/b6 domain-containing protein [Alteraurantiacibacter aquimixticola]|uniref:Polyisoprenoid-binding protein n=1 Tax=Alteraurantiacibacter aquimixticola TaxID=2489173 RepID=A0A4T3F661_9SPHN|nr:cytochrome b/b6 domain-containing protein [Alteraurantiacibacter aquimixticola]TIX51904.1 polyisoprenoid-binding protein [Alteraurantiacibacter aquimixticola]
MGIGVERYSKGAILLHWLIALALAAEIAIGFGMPHDASGFALFQLHKSIGITILLLSLLRLGWRFTHKPPPKLEGGFNGFLASSVHVLFYVFMIAAPLTGWAIVSTAPIDVPTLLFGVVPWPHLPLPASLNEPVEEVHEILAFLGIALFVLHVAGALRHHFLMRDHLLLRMAPGNSAGMVLGLLAGVVLLGGATFALVRSPDSHDDHDHEVEAALGDAEAIPAELDDAEGEDGTEEGEKAAEEAAAAEETEAVEEAEEEGAEEPEEPVVAAAAPPPSWSIQPGGSLRFTVDNGGTPLNGSFSRWGGSIVMDPAAPASANLAINVELGSATLGDATQDQMLTGAEFFAVSSFSTATFRSTDVTSTGNNSYRARGTLTIKGTSRPQVINFTLSGSGNRRSVSGSGTIDRNAFGVGTGSSAENLGGNVQLRFAFDASR